MYFDTHAHYDSGAFNEDRLPLLASMPEKGVELIIDPGCDLISSRKAIELAERFDFVYAAVGWHPEDIDKLTEEDYRSMESLAQHKKCVAIGEIGLDYYWDASQKDVQKALFRRQAELALRLNKPVIVHDREAHADSLDIVCDYPELRGVFHCYSGSVEMARELWKLGWYTGFDGPVTYKNARRTVEAVQEVPLERLLLETDSPYMAPVPKRGTRNDSRNIRCIAEKIAEIRNMTADAIIRVSAENGRRLFGI